MAIFGDVICRMAIFWYVILEWPFGGRRFRVVEAEGIYGARVLAFYACVWQITETPKVLDFRSFGAVTDI